jgi:hypothetical protein
MEIGSLAEWVAGIAEALAVTVALFLPYYQKRKADKNSNQRAKQVITRTANKMIKENDVQTGGNFIELKRFIEIYSVLATSDKTVEIITYGDSILEIVGDSNQLDDKQIADIKQLLKKLDEVKL